MVDEKELDKIRKLPPKERLARLKELEDKRKREETEARKIIEDSLKEIKIDEMLQEIEVPKQDQVNIDKLFEQAKDIGAQVNESDIKRIKKGGTDYSRRIQELLPQNTLEEIQGWYAQDSRTPSREEFLEVYDNARQAYDVVKHSMQNAPDKDLYSTPSEELVESVVSSMHLLRSLGYKMDWFHP